MDQKGDKILDESTQAAALKESPAPSHVEQASTPVPVTAAPASYEKVIQVNRTAKVVKGGRRFHFSALVVIGNGAGEVGFALGKANEVADAIRKALIAAQKNKIKISLKDATIPHEVIGRYGAARVFLK